jgi:hypothetical protein
LAKWIRGYDREGCVTVGSENWVNCGAIVQEYVELIEVIARVRAWRPLEALFLIWPSTSINFHQLLVLATESHVKNTSSIKRALGSVGRPIGTSQYRHRIQQRAGQESGGLDGPLSVEAGRQQPPRGTPVVRQGFPISLINVNAKGLMTTLRLAKAAAIILFVSAITAGLAWAQAPAALVLECDGATTPAMSPYYEVMAGTDVKLEPGSRLVFVDYYSCTRIIVSGAGVVTFAARGYSFRGAGTSTSVRVPCPREITIDGGGQSSAAVLRGGGGELRSFSTRPELVLVGRHAADITSVRFSKGAEQVMEGALNGRRFIWPASAPGLTDGGVYQLALIGKSSRPRVITFRAATAAGQDQGQVLIRVD